MAKPLAMFLQEYPANGTSPSPIKKLRNLSKVAHVAPASVER